MLTTIKCPHCKKFIGTDSEVGELIPCPHCAEEFEMRASHIARSKGWDTFIKLCIPLGYVLFVALPLGGTIWFFVNRMEKQEREEAQAQAQAQMQREREREEAIAADAKPPAVKPPAPNPPRKKPRPQPTDPNPGGAVTPPEKDDPIEPVEPDPTPRPPVVRPPVRPMPPTPAVVVAPEPRLMPEIEVAPPPRAAGWRIALVEPEAKWQTVGAVDVRLAGYAVTKIPLARGDQVFESTAAVLVVEVAVRMNTDAKKRELQSWRYGGQQTGTMFMAGDRELPFVELPLGTRPNTGLLPKQPIPGDGTPVRDVLLFAVPPADAGELNLRLPAERLGEGGDIWLKIPADSWKKK